MSKGSSRRPAAVPPETVAANYERTFGVSEQQREYQRRFIAYHEPNSTTRPPRGYIDIRGLTPSGPSDAEA